MCREASNGLKFEYKNVRRPSIDFLVLWISQLVSSPFFCFPCTFQSKRMSRYPSDRKVYVGELGNNARKNEIEYVFSSYGTLRSVWVARNPPGFAFVEFEDARDAADAVRGLDGRTICGRRARVELSTGKYGKYGGGDREERGRDRRGGSRSRGKPFHPDDKCYECGGRGHYARDCRRYGRSRRR